MQTKSTTTPIANLLRLMTALVLLVGMFGFTRTGTVYALNSIIYVKADADGAKNGSSWADAYTSLQDALSVAVGSDQIWVAAGTYYPTTDGDRTATFTLQSGVSIYGGFDGTETLLTDRDIAANITILSGDIGTPGNTGDNSYHVVTGGGTDSSAVLDGFTITAGNANLLVVDGTDQYGGGLFNESSSPTLSHLIITGNTANYGAGIFNNGSSPSLTNVVVSNNYATRGAGMYSTLSSYPVLLNVTFSGNTATDRGGGMSNSGSSPQLTNVTFGGNTAESGAGLSNVFGSSPILTNVTFSGNTASLDEGVIYNYDNSNPIITNSILYGNTGGEIYIQPATPTVLASTPVVTYSIVQGGYTGTENLDQDPLLGTLTNNGGFTQTMALGTGSPAIDAGSDVSCPLTDQRGLTRPQGLHCDMGAYEVDTSAPNTSIDSYPSNPSNSSSASFTFSGDDGGGSGIGSFECQLDGGDFGACTSPTSYDSLLDGEHIFQVRAIDNVGNVDAIPASYTWTVDTTSIFVSSILRSNASPTSASSVGFTVTFSADVTNVDTGDFVLTTTELTGASVSGVSGSGDTYAVTVNSGTGNGTIRLDVSGLSDIEGLSGNPVQNLPYAGDELYSIIKTGTFEDVPNTHWAWRFIEGLYNAGVTSGCSTSPMLYCPTTTVTRDQMAVFLLRAKHGSSYSPPAATGVFQDVPTNYWAAAWIEQLAAEGITGGCSVTPKLYCPTTPVTRDQMAVFLLRSEHGSSYSPPAASGVFQDVPTDYWAASWIERLAAEGITGGCSTTPMLYCPTTPVTRDQMAVFLDRTFGIPPLP